MLTVLYKSFDISVTFDEITYADFSQEEDLRHAFVKMLNDDYMFIIVIDETTLYAYFMVGNNELKYVINDV